MFMKLKSTLLTIGALLAVTTPVVAHVHVDTPNGGEVLEVGSDYTVTWHIVIAHTPQNWDLWYSTRGSEGPWTPIQMDLPPGSGAVGSVHTYDWTIPAEAVSDQVRVRVRMDNRGTDYEDISDEDFTVVEPSLTSVFMRGNADGQGALNITDGIFILNFLFLGGPEPSCLDAADTDDNGSLNISDAVAVFNFLFLGGAEPPAPGPIDCGPDPTTEDELNCAEFLACP